MKVVAALMLAVMTGATLGGAPQRDRPVVPVVPAGTGLISGVLTIATNSTTPVRRAVVSLISGDGLTGRSVVTDDQGAFSFRAVPAGRYTLTAQKAAHIKNRYGAKRPGRPGSSIVLADGQQLTGITFALPPGGVIVGTLRLESGDPMPNTQVLAIPAAQATVGGRYLGPADFVSDDQGAFRIFGLAPGSYLLAALPAVGRGEVEIRTEAAPAETPDLRGYAPTYFPGTPVVTDAVPITVGAGEVKDGIDIPITMFRMSTVSGTVMGTDGRPAQAIQLTADPVGPPLPSAASLTVRANRPDAQGRFTINNVPPGSYRISARGGGVTLGPDGATMSISPDAQTEWATAEVQVSGDNVDGVHLILQSGLTFDGQLLLDNGPPEGLKGAQLTVQSVGLSGTPVRSASVQASGRFTVGGIQPGLYEVTLRLPGLGTTWAIRSMIARGVELRDAPLTFAQGSITGATITVSNHRSEVAGTLSTATGVPATDYYVIIFASDRALWHPTSPRVRVVRPGVDGAFSARDLPAGDYRIAALTDVEDEEWKTAGFLASLLDVSLAVAVKDGETTRQDIRIR